MGHNYYNYSNPDGWMDHHEETRESHQEHHQQLQQHSYSMMESGGSSSGGRVRQPHMTLYNSVIEEKIVIEQVDTSRSRLLAEQRVNSSILNCMLIVDVLCV